MIERIFKNIERVLGELVASVVSVLKVLVRKGWAETPGPATPGLRHSG